MIDDPLQRRRTLPDGGSFEAWRADDGWVIRTARWDNVPGGRGSILFVGGRADFIEKYCEAYWVWRAWGMGLATFDWRGQGLSGRLGGDAHRGHATDFERWVDDFGGIVDWFVRTLMPPHFIIAHSMGAHLTLRHLARGDTRIARAVLLAPLLGIKTEPVPDAAARGFVHAVERLGHGLRYGPLQRPYGAWQRRPLRQAILTGSVERFEDEHWWIETNPGLGLGGATYGWLASAYRSIDALLAPGAIERITTPTLVLMGEHERLVDPAAAERAAARLPDGTYGVIPNAAHELLRETDGVQAEVQRRIRRFLLPT